MVCYSTTTLCHSEGIFVDTCLDPAAAGKDPGSALPAPSPSPARSSSPPSSRPSKVEKPTVTSRASSLAWSSASQLHNHRWAPYPATRPDAPWRQAAWKPTPPKSPDRAQINQRMASRESPYRRLARPASRISTAADPAARCHKAALEGRSADLMRFYAGPRRFPLMQDWRRRSLTPAGSAPLAAPPTHRS